MNSSNQTELSTQRSTRAYKFKRVRTEQNKETLINIRNGTISSFYFQNYLNGT